MIQLEGLTKRYGAKLAVDGLTATIKPGLVTGFLGPNGAGKSTTMRMIMGLDRPTAGRATIDGRPLSAQRAPLTKVGALLDAKSVHPSRSGRAHLLALAATNGISKRRVEQMIQATGLEAVASRRTKTYSLGMHQRLGIAAALLGDPAVVVLDEPVNGLDPEGVLWVRRLARSLAAEGRTVFLSSHLMSEMSQTADHLIIIGRGRLLADAPIDDIIAGASEEATRVRSPQAAQIAAALASHSVTVTTEDAETIVLTGIGVKQIGEAAATNGWVIYEMTPITSSLEEAYMSLTDSAVEYRSASPVLEGALS
ncbi:MAG: ATP-binding cassette domain-containing protein [Bifidobacteriaceae bacterium]|jgi:ABC-2 type transport system ATP-binding protein|nr:ATP-binding cassette domain-containing protein [Bifidobacteriaceae bacterium]